jgi:hypothetical protein
MPGFFDKVRGEAVKAAFEADRLRRVNQAQGVLKGMQRELDGVVAGWGPQVLALYDAGTLTQPELLAACPQIDELRQKIAAQEAEIERIRQDKPPEPEVTAPTPVEVRQATPAPAVGSEPAAGPAAPGKARFCGNCGSPLPADVKFCPECGTKTEG